MEIDPIRIWKLLTQPLTGRHPIRACRAQPKMWQKASFYWFSSLFLWSLLLSTWLDNKHRNHWPLYVLASRPFSANADKQQSISENMYLAHISRTCIPHVSIICLFFCFDCWEYCFIVAFNEVEKIPKICISHVYLAHVSRMRVIVACVHTRVGSKVKSKFKFKPLHF